MHQGFQKTQMTAAILKMSECCVSSKINVPQPGMLTFTLIYQVICVFVRYGHVGCQLVSVC